MGEGNEMNDFVEASRSIKKPTALVLDRYIIWIPIHNTKCKISPTLY